VRAVAGTQEGISKPADSAPAGQAGPAAVCLVRQPVFNAAEELLGHRLLSSTDGSSSPGGYLAAMPQGEDAELALAEQLHAIAPRRQVLLSVSRTELLARRALSLPHDRVVLCLPAAEPIDDDLLDALDRHVMRGFRLALDAVDLATVDGPLFDRAQTVTVAVGAHSQHQFEELVASVRQRTSRRKLLACGVDSRGSFQICWRLGFDMFQGQFFLKATDAPIRTVAQAGLGAIRTMVDLATTEDFEGLTTIITRDPGLSMRVLRYANSAHTDLPRQVGSVHEALTWLGAEAVREFALIAALTNVPECPAETLVTALTRARMCQQLSRGLPATTAEEAFTVGLFSVAEAVTNARIETVIGELPLRANIASTLIDGAGELGHLLATVIAYERGDFAAPRTRPCASNVVAQTYLESLRWADSAVNAIG
jgi:c-di-GMP phosphodiesterase